MLQSLGWPVVIAWSCGLSEYIAPRNTVFSHREYGVTSCWAMGTDLATRSEDALHPHLRGGPRGQVRRHPLPSRREEAPEAETAPRQDRAGETIRHECPAETDARTETGHVEMGTTVSRRGDGAASSLSTTERHEPPLPRRAHREGLAVRRPTRHQAPPVTGDPAGPPGSSPRTTGASSSTTSSWRWPSDARSTARTPTPRTAGSAASRSSSDPCRSGCRRSRTGS